LGFTNGVVQVRPMEDLKVFLDINVHDNVPISGVSLSFDDRILTTTAKDGMVSLDECLVSPVGLVRLPDVETSSTELTDLESHHTHFFLVSGDEWGDKSPCLDRD
jgi:hypothetical protein